MFDVQANATASGDPRMTITLEGVDDVARFVHNQLKYGNQSLGTEAATRLRDTEAGQAALDWLKEHGGLDLTAEADVH